MAFGDYSGYGEYSAFGEYAGYVATKACYDEAMKLREETEKMVIDEAKRQSDVNMTKMKAHMFALKLVNWGMRYFNKELTQKYSNIPALHSWVQLEITDNEHYFCSTLLGSWEIQRALRRIDI